MWHAIVDILTMSQEKIKFRENRGLCSRGTNPRS